MSCMANTRVLRMLVLLLIVLGVAAHVLADATRGSTQTRIDSRCTSLSGSTLNAHGEPASSVFHIGVLIPAPTALVLPLGLRVIMTLAGPISRPRTFPPPFLPPRWLVAV
jgi:hypothetical protein